MPNINAPVLNSLMDQRPQDAVARAGKKNPDLPVSATVPAEDAGTDMLSAVDSVPIDDLVLNVMPQIEKIPNEFIEAWGTAFEKVCAQFRDCINTGEVRENDTVAMRHLKWYLGLHQFLLCKRPRNRIKRRQRRNRHDPEGSYLAERFLMLAERRYKDLIEAWRRDREAYLRSRSRGAQRQRDRPLAQNDLQAQRRVARKCSQFIREYHISRGIKQLEGNGVVEATMVVDQMLEKHPKARTELRWSSTLPEDANPASVEATASWLALLDVKSGSGTDGRRPHYLKCLATYDFGDSGDSGGEGEGGFSRAIETFESLWQGIIEDKLPPWAYHYLTYGKLCTLVKKPPRTPGEVPDARPVNAGLIDRRVVEKSLVKRAGDQLRAHLEPQQLAIGTKYGCEALLWGTRWTLEQHPDWVCVTLDLKNAHNAFDRAKAMEALKATILDGSVGATDAEWEPAAKTIVKAFHCLNFPTSQIYSPTADGTLAKICEGDEGGPQGSPLTPVAFAMLIDPILKKYDAMDGVTVRAIADDITVCLKLDENTSERIDEMCDDLFTECGLRVTRRKCGYYRPEGADQRTKGLMPPWLNPKFDDEGNPGVVIVGAPIGSEAFTRKWLLDQAGGIGQRIKETSKLIGEEDSHAAHMALVYSLQHRFNYIMATNLPEYTAEAAAKIDESLQVAMVNVWGVNLWDEASTSSQGQYWPRFVAERATLPCKYGGSGVDRTTSFVHTAFVNSVTHCISRLFTVRGSEAADPQVGLFDHLRPMFELDESSPLAFDAERRPGVVEAWIRRSLEAVRRNIGKSYHGAWEEILRQGEEVEAQALTPQDMRDILFGSAESVTRTQDGTSGRHSESGRADTAEQSGQGETHDGNNTNGTGAGEDGENAHNPFNWTVDQLISHPQKLQWRVRQVLAKAKWKQLHKQVSSAAAGHPEQGANFQHGLSSQELGKQVRSDMRFMSFTSVDHFARAPLLGMCWEAPFRNEEFREFISHYFGLASPACRAIEGTQVRRGSNSHFHVDVDREGVHLITAANGPRALRTKQHNELQDALVTEARRAGINAVTHHVIDTEEALRTSNWQGSGIVQAQHPEDAAGDGDSESPSTQIRPDIVFDFGTQQEIPFPDAEKPTQGAKMLFDVKTLGLRKNGPYLSKQSYKPGRRFQDQESRAVRKRSDEVNGEYLKKAKARDRRFVVEEASGELVPEGEEQQEQEGPYTRTIKSHGKVQGLVIGVFGEFSREWDRTIRHIARKRAVVARRASGANIDEDLLASRIRRHMIKHIGSKGARGIVRLKLEVVRELAGVRQAGAKSRFQRADDSEMQRLAEDRSRARFGRGFSAT